MGRFQTTDFDQLLNQLPGDIALFRDAYLKNRSLSDAVRVFLMRVVADKQLPFTLKVPNTETRAAMLEAEDIVRSRSARFSNADQLFDALEKERSK